VSFYLHSIGDIYIIIILIIIIIIIIIIIVAVVVVVVVLVVVLVVIDQSVYLHKVITSEVRYGWNFINQLE